MAELTDEDQAMLEFERHRWKYPGAKASAVHDQFGISMTRYVQVLNRLIDDPAAMGVRRPAGEAAAAGEEQAAAATLREASGMTEPQFSRGGRRGRA